MADLDEESPQTAPPDSADIDDEPQDFRFLSALSHATNQQTLPRRGEKDFEQHGTLSQNSILEASQQAMHDALSHPRTHNPKSLITAQFTPSSSTPLVVSQPKGAIFKTMGKSDSFGRLSLLPEEALYLLERGSLDIRWGEGQMEGLPLSLQAAYSYLIGDKGLSLERYTVYGGLKRGGYVVQRGPAWYPEDHDADYIKPRERDKAPPLGLFAWLYNSLLSQSPPTPPPQGPLVQPGLYRSYASIYRLLTLIPSHDSSEPTDRESSRSSASMGHPNSPTHPRIRVSFYVWKPSSEFKKSAPSPPDFRIAVLNAREQGFPVYEQVDDLLQSVPYDPPPPELKGSMYARLKHGWRNVVLAVVDQGVVSYMRLADAGFSKEKLYEVGVRGGGKRGGRRGGRGRGRARGRY